MNPSPDGLFGWLDPPEGGLEKLRRRLDGRLARPRSRGLRLVLAGSLCSVVTALVVLGLALGPLVMGRAAFVAPLLDPDDFGVTPALLALGQGRLPSEPVTVLPAERGRVAVLRVPTANPQVILYRVATLPEAAGQAEP